MPHRAEGRTNWKIWVGVEGGARIGAGCGTDSLATAQAMESMIKSFKRQRTAVNTHAVRLVVEKKAALREVFDAFENGTLEILVDRFTKPGPVDLSPLVDLWPDGTERARTQVRCMIPAGKCFPATEFTKQNVKTFLDGLTIERTKPVRLVSKATKRRYKSALQTFGSWLVELDHIPPNPVKDLRSWKVKKPPPRFFDRREAKALIEALPMPNRAIEALMAATGVEWQVIGGARDKRGGGLRRRDIDLDAKTILAQGFKNEWRNRTVRATELWAWEIFADYVRAGGFTPNALLFEGVREDTTVRVHHRVAKVLQLKHTTLHDWRHTYAVQALRDGYKATTVARQLGHANAYLVWTTYGRYVPDDRDYVRQGFSSSESFQAA